ncbi:hypothetical protein [Syntrophomonas wolfei]|uniref:hypothetical protein n=1 Tax=Syntrophomonas wolfei TaxID=863 RepID=UPI000774491C|nr:hypothetical protein [Syntrophomonas wolfei]
MKLIDNEERLCIPLYHGTSTCMLESIKEYGLGGRNIIEEYKVLDFLEYTYNLARSGNYISEPDYLIKLILNQRVTEAGYNFRHGQVYLTPSLDTAKRYKKNLYGSEIISHLVDLFTKYPNNNNDDVFNDNHPLFHFLRETPEPRPLVLKIPQLHISALLEGENGQPVLEVLDKLRKAMYCSELAFEIFSQQNNFVLGQVIPFDKLEIVS